MKKKLITSALPYVNNVPHLGNIIGCVLSADVYARFCRARGYETLYICGNDEYGTATENKAREEGLTPREICDKYHVIHADIYRDFHISFDAFGRTSTETQTEIAQGIFLDLEKNGLISEKSSARTYCERDSIFLADRYVEGTCPHCNYEDARGDQCDRCGKLLEPEALIRPRCKICGTPPVLRETAHLYLNLDQLNDRLRTWFEERSTKGAWTKNAQQTTLGWLDRGLQPRPITRDLSWGIPVPKPGYENKVFYVWYDAPIGYISITAHAFENWREWWHRPDEVELYQFMAKDNIPFHTVIFPSSLLGTGKPWTTLHHINSTEYLNYEDTKFSKSRNIGVFGDDVRETGIPADLWRFYLLLIRPERNDSVFNWNEFFERVNSDFIDNIGNLVNRALVYLAKNFDGEIKDVPLDEEHRAFIAACREEFAAVTEALEAVRLRDGLRLILALGNRGNKFFQDMAPWEYLKTRPERAHGTVASLAYLVRCLAVALEPYMPATAEQILSMMNLKRQTWAMASSFSGLDGHRIGRPAILYRKLDTALAEKFRKKFSGNAPQLGRFQLTCGRITQVAPHPHSDRLYELRVDLGEAQPRTIVAGLTQHYTEADLLGRKVVVLANLPAAEIRGVLSQGMVLVGEKRNKMDLLDGGPFPVGQTLDAPVVTDAAITVDDFKQAPFRLENGRVHFDGEVVTMGGRPLTCDVLKNGKIR